MSPCSGHGFTFTPVLEAIGADVVEGADPWAREWRLPACRPPTPPEIDAKGARNVDFGRWAG